MIWRKGPAQLYSNLDFHINISYSSIVLIQHTCHKWITASSTCMCTMRALSNRWVCPEMIIQSTRRTRALRDVNEVYEQAHLPQSFSASQEQTKDCLKWRKQLKCAYWFPEPRCNQNELIVSKNKMVITAYINQTWFVWATIQIIKDFDLLSITLKVQLCHCCCCMRLAMPNSHWWTVTQALYLTV